MVASHRKNMKQSNNGKSQSDFANEAGSSSSSIDGMNLNEDCKKGDMQQQQSKNQPNPKHQKQPAADNPKKPPTSYNFFVNDKKVEILRNNPGMSPMEFSSLAGKMFKALSEKKKQKYVELARVAREKYKRKVQEFKEANDPIPKSVETLETGGPPAPTPFSIFCTLKKKQKKSISWCTSKFASLPDKEKLKWIDLALAKEASYLEEFKKFKAENPHLNPKLKPILNEQEKLLVHMRDVMPVKPPSTAFHLFASEYPPIPNNKDENPEMRMAQCRAGWNALSKEEKQIYEMSLEAINYEYDMKLSTCLSNFPMGKRQQEITNCVVDAKRMKRKKGDETDKCSASSKKSKSTLCDENDSESSEGEKTPTLLKIGSKKNATPVKGSDNKSVFIAIDSSDESDHSDDLTLPNKKILPPNLGEKSSKKSTEENDAEPVQSNLPKKIVPMLAATDVSASFKQAKFRVRNPPRPDTSSSISSVSMSHASSSSSKSRKKVTQSGTERIVVQRKEETSDESDRSEEAKKSSGPNTKSSAKPAKASSSKTKNGVHLQKKSSLKCPPTSTAVDSNESDSDDNSKLSAYCAKLPTAKRRQAILKCVPDAKGMIRKKRAETDKSSVSTKKRKPALEYENDLDVQSDDVTYPKKKVISPRKSEEEEEESHGGSGSDFEPEQLNLSKKSRSALNSSEPTASKSAKKAKSSSVNPPPRHGTSGSDPSSTSNSDEAPQKMRRASSSSFKFVKKMPPAVTESIAIQSEEETSDEDDSSEEEKN